MKISHFSLKYAHKIFNIFANFYYQLSINEKKKSKKLKKSSTPSSKQKKAISQLKILKNNKMKGKKKLLKFWENNFMNMLLKFIKILLLCCLHLMQFKFYAETRKRLRQKIKYY